MRWIGRSVAGRGDCDWRLIADLGLIGLTVRHVHDHVSGIETLQKAWRLSTIAASNSISFGFFSSDSGIKCTLTSAHSV